jgi:hypothetical protein
MSEGEWGESEEGTHAEEHEPALLVSKDDESGDQVAERDAARPEADDLRGTRQQGRSGGSLGAARNREREREEQRTGIPGVGERMARRR